MNTETGQIRMESQLTKEQKSSGRFVRLSDDEYKRLCLMNRKQRRQWAKANHSSVEERLEEWRKIREAASMQGDT